MQSRVKRVLRDCLASELLSGLDTRATYYRRKRALASCEGPQGKGAMTPTARQEETVAETA